MIDVDTPDSDGRKFIRKSWPRGKRPLPRGWSAAEYEIAGKPVWIFSHNTYGETRNEDHVFNRTEEDWNRNKSARREGYQEYQRFCDANRAAVVAEGIAGKEIAAELGRRWKAVKREEGSRKTARDGSGHDGSTGSSMPPPVLQQPAGSPLAYGAMATPAIAQSTSRTAGVPPSPPTPNGTAPLSIEAMREKRLAALSSKASGKLKMEPHASGPTPAASGQQPARPLVHEEGERVERARASPVRRALREDMERSVGYRHLALTKHIETTAEVYRNHRDHWQQLSAPLTFNLRRDCLAADMLHELSKLSKYKIFARTFRVRYRGEEGKDDGGLTIDMFARAHKSLYSDPQLGGFFHQRGRTVVPLADALARKLPPVALPYPDAGAGSSSSSGAIDQVDLTGDTQDERPRRAKRARSAAPAADRGDSQHRYNSERVMELCGRLLAFKMILGGEVVVDDKLPLFVVEYLATDNALSLDHLDGALDAMESIDTDKAVLMRCLLEHGVQKVEAVWSESYRVCDLYPPSAPYTECRRCGDGTSDIDAHLVKSSSQCTQCARLLDLTRPQLESHIVDAAKYAALGCRRAHLDALKRGFQGYDHVRDEQGVLEAPYDFQWHLALFTPRELATYIRGRDANVSELVSLLRFKRPDESASQRHLAPIANGAAWADMKA